MPDPDEPADVDGNAPRRAANADWQTRLRTVGVGFGLAVAGFVVANVLALVAFSLLLGAGLPLGSDPTLRYPLLTVVVGLGFVLVVAAYIAVADRYHLVNVRWPTPRDLGWTVLGVLALLAALVAISVLFRALGVDTASHRIEELGREHPELLIYMLPLAFLVIGPSEELLFRGVIQGLLRRAYRPLPAILIASVIFAVGHVTALAGSSGRGATILAILLLGGILGALYEHTDNLVVPVLVHGAYDAIAFAQIYVAATGLG